MFIGLGKRVMGKRHYPCSIAATSILNKLIDRVSKNEHQRRTTVHDNGDRTTKLKLSWAGHMASHGDDIKRHPKWPKSDYRNVNVL